MKKDKTYDKSVYQAFALVTQFGINMLVPILMMTAIGMFLDTKLHTSWISVVLFFVGAVAGGQNVYRMAKSFMNSPDERLKKRDKKGEGNRSIKKGE